MKQLDKLRATLRKHYETKEAAFDDVEWERASAYLNAARRKRKTRYFAFILIALFTGVSVTLFNFQKTNTDPGHVLAARPEGKSGSINAPQVASHNEKPELTSHSARSSTGKRSDFPSHTPEAERKSNTSVSVVQGNPSDEKPLPPLEPPINRKVTNPDKKKNITREEKIIPPGLFHITDTSSVDITHNTAKQEDSGFDAEGGLIVKDSIIHRAVIPDEVQNREQEAFVPSPGSLPEAGASTGDTVIEAAKTRTIEITNGYNGSHSSFVDTSVHNESIEITGMMNEPEDSLYESSLPIHLAGEGFFYEAGAAWYNGWQGPAKRDARGLSPVAGINYMNRLTDNCSVSFGVQYIQVRNLAGSSKTSRISTYEYGEQSFVTVVTPSTMHYLVAPLRLHYYLNRLNSFGTGVNLAYLLNIDASVTSYTERPGVKSNYKTIKLSGYTEGFSWFDSQLTFFYRRKIGRSLGLQTEIFLGLTDVKQDAFFDLHYKERNSGFKLTLIYYAFRKKY